jgi:hypothetical protein
MPNQTRLTDLTLGYGSHGLPCCGHVIVGVRITGSGNHNTNGMATSRVTDISSHDCFHPESKLFINNKIAEFQDANIGDKIINMHGEIGKIKNINKKSYDGILKKIYYRGTVYPLIVTPDHYI